MFYLLKDLHYKVWLHPTNMKALLDIEGTTEDKNKSSYWKRLVQQKAWHELERSFVSEIGFIIQMLKIDEKDIGDGIIMPQTGFMEHSLSYSAIILRPYRGEVIDAVIHTVTRQSVIFCYVEIVHGIIKIEEFPIEDDFEFKEVLTKNEKGESEVSKIFVSLTTPTNILRKGVAIRLRITDWTYGNEGNGMWLTGTMKSKYLCLRSGVQNNRRKPIQEDSAVRTESGLTKV